MKTLKNWILDFLQSDVFSVCAGRALAYAYIRLALAFMDCFVR